MELSPQPFAVAAFVGLLAVCTPLAGAQATPDASQDTSWMVEEGFFDSLSRQELIDYSGGQLLFALDSLLRLDAFDFSEDPGLEAEVREVMSGLEDFGLSDEDHRFNIEIFVSEWPIAIEELDGVHSDLSPEVLDLSDLIESGAVGSAISGGEPLDSPLLWLDSLGDLLLREGSAPLGDAGSDSILIAKIVDSFAAAPVPPSLNFVDTTQPATGASAADVTSTTLSDAVVTSAVSTTEAALDSSSENAQSSQTEPSQTESSQTESSQIEASQGSGLPLVVPAGAGAVVVLGAGLMLRRRSRSVGARQTHSAVETIDPDDSLDVIERAEAQASAKSSLPLAEVLDASRRMTSTVDSQEIAAIALGEAVKLGQAQAGLFVVRQGSELATLAQHDAGSFVLSALRTSAVRRVFETGQSVAAVLSEEPLFAKGSQASVAVPVISSGSIGAVVLLTREADRPFSRNDIDALELLAPLVGSALQSAESHGSATRLADVEPLTGLKNRRCLDRDLAEVDRETTISYFMLDVDNFKNFNDTNGHAAGDEALRCVADLLSANVRPSDVVYRYGGEEFCVLLPGTNAATASVVAERVRAAIQASSIPGQDSQPNGSVTVSIGVADTTQASSRTMVERADAALYVAKRSGRNQVRLDGDAAGEKAAEPDEQA